jgi:hypothetical protein
MIIVYCWKIPEPPIVEILEILPLQLIYFLLVFEVEAELNNFLILWVLL